MVQNIDTARPAFVVTIDTEGDNQWARGAVIETRNARFLPRFQALCEKYGVRPTWLTNWEMATAPEYQEFARDVLARDAGEVGMHLHAWNSPPEIPLTDNDYKYHPYLIEFPEHLIREKVKVMTEALENVFGVKMVSHRAGRFSFNEIYARILVEHGYRIDGSVTPNVSWKMYPGNPKGNGGTDFSKFPQHAYFLDLDDISRPGDSPLLEIPVTVTAPYFPPIVDTCRAALSVTKFTRRVSNRLFPKLSWLYPMKHNHRMLRRLLLRALFEKRTFAEFMIHSSELMPGGSPTFVTERSIDAMYVALEGLFELARDRFDCLTMKEFRSRFAPAAHSSTVGVA